MRLHASLLFVLFASAARAATIPDDVTIEKKLAIPQENIEKIQEIESSDPGQIDQSNVINDVDNKLRTNAAEVPVKVQNVDQALKTSEESDEIIRPAVDLKNPGPPQRQEHETQNPEFYSAEQDFAQTYKNNINKAHVFLKQGFQGITDGIQNLFENNEQIQGVRISIQKLREDFVSQIDKLNGTVQSYLEAGSSDSVSPDDEQTKANIQVIETGLNAIKDDFNKGVKTLTEGVEVLSAVRAQNEKQEPNQPSTTSPSPTPAGSGNPLMNLISGFQNNVQSGMANLTNTISNFISQGPSIFRPGSSSTAAPVDGQPAGTQADSPLGQGPTLPFGGFGSGTGPLILAFQTFQNSFQQFFSNPLQGISIFGNQPSSTTKPSESTATENSSNTTSQSDQVRVTQAPATQVEPVTQPGPIRQILQNNPISQGIAATVQRLQNINNPEKPRETEKSSPDTPVSEDKKKGHSSGSGE